MSEDPTPYQHDLCQATALQGCEPSHAPDGATSSDLSADAEKLRAFALELFDCLRDGPVDGDDVERVALKHGLFWEDRATETEEDYATEVGDRILRLATFLKHPFQRSDEVGAPAPCEVSHNDGKQLDTSKKSLGQIAFLQHHMRGFPPFTEEEAHLFWGELEERERQEWEAAAQAVRLHVLEEAAKVAETVHWGTCTPPSAPYNLGLNSGAQQMQDAIVEAIRSLKYSKAEGE